MRQENDIPNRKDAIKSRMGWVPSTLPIDGSSDALSSTRPIGGVPGASRSKLSDEPGTLPILDYSSAADFTEFRQKSA